MSPVPDSAQPLTVPLYQVDAFTNVALKGNQAAVMPLNAWLPDDKLAAIAAENNLAETAFLVAEPAGGEADYEIRWFTPSCEVPLCGHATLASAHVIFQHLSPQRDTVVFRTRQRGLLTVRRGDDGLLVMDFPTSKLRPMIIPEALDAVLRSPVLEVMRYDGDDLFVVLDSPARVKALAPQLTAFAEVKARGIIVTAEANRDQDGCDFVCRYFAPGWGIDEDPVTGSIHTALVPFWARRLGRDSLISRQVSRRGGTLYCRALGDRTEIAGHSVLYLSGQVYL
ncbi:PhzF family phenazine biosynthesis protein [Insolitispirillum peregrinum]|uniref:PhzF family phenazine biosynthesis protein n=1 Tax=Insolitispirillum peregrinum TaxID=80876 RepID=UPI00360943BA